jgi:anti-sigma-K factor RskA
MNEHKKINKLLVDFALGELSQEQANQVRAHLTECPECSSEIKRIEALLECTDNIRKSSPDERMCKSARQAILQAVERQKIKQLTSGPNIGLEYIRKTIMKNKITEIAAAAVVIAVVLIGVTLIDKSATSAYAFEQTIRAMRSVSSVRAYCTDWDGTKGEVLVQINPETGQEEYYYADIGNLLIVATPQKTFYYYKDKNLVRIRNEHVLAAEVRFSRLFEDLPDLIQRLNGKLEFKSEFDQVLQKQVIRIHAYIPAQKDFAGRVFIISVDPKTKLPINTDTIKGEPGQGVKSVDRFEYNVPIPQGLFDFEIPEGAEVIYE